MSFLKPEKDVVFCERFKAIRHPLSECRHGSDHDRLRQLYIELLERCVGDPLEQARQIVIQEILQSYMHDHTTVPKFPVQTAVCHIKIAISSLALLMCDLERGDHDAAAKSLEATHQSLQIVSDYLNKKLDSTEVLV